MVDDMLDYHKTCVAPAWQHAPAELKFQALFLERSPPTRCIRILENILPYPMGNIHPRWGWVFGTGTVTGAWLTWLAP
jgi:hypothetical protein